MNLASICYFFLIFSHFTYYIVLGIGMHAYAEALGNGFWARDITFRNTTGPEKEQAVAMRVSSNHSIFYRCSFEAYQDNLYVESNLQFYHNCQIQGTIDFIFGDAAVVFQKCDIYLRKPMKGQSNMITAQGRWFPQDHTGIAIQMSRVLPSPEFQDVKGSYHSFLGRPWKEYSRTVCFQTYLDEFIDPKGWAVWNGSFALSTLFYGEYNNSGGEASTKNRVKWKTFHVLNTQQVMKFTVSRFISEDDWIPESGVPFSPGLL